MLLTNPRLACSQLTIGEARPTRREEIRLVEAARTRGTVIRGAPGSGKTTLLAMIVYGDLHRGKPALVIDAKGALKRLVLQLILRLPEARRRQLLSRLRLWPVGHLTRTYGLPWLHSPGAHDRRAQRFLDVTMKLVPSLADRPIMGKPSLYAIGLPVLMILSSLGYQITEALDLLYDATTPGSIWPGKLAEAEAQIPQAVHLLHKTYLQWPENVRRERRYAFESRIIPYLLSDTLRALAGSTESLDLAAAEEQGLTLLVDTSAIEEEMVRDEFTLHLFHYFLDYIKRRGVAEVKPWSLVLEEAATLMRTEALIPDIQALANEYRNHRLQPTISFQTINQVSQRMVELLYSFGSHWIGKTNSSRESDLEADFLLTYAPHLVKFPGYPHYGHLGMMTGHNNPIFFTVEEQRRMLSDNLKAQRGRQFLVSRYLDGSNPETGINRVTATLDFPDTRWISEADLHDAEEENLARYALEVVSVLKEVDGRIPRRDGKGRQKKQPLEPKQLALLSGSSVGYRMEDGFQRKAIIDDDADTFREKAQAQDHAARSC